MPRADVPPLRVVHAADAGGAWDSYRVEVDPRLRRHVRRVEGWSEHAVGLRERAELPMAGVLVMLQFGAPLRVQDVPGAAPHDVGSFVAGLGVQPVRTQVRGRASGIHLELTPLGAARLLGLPLSEVACRVVDVDELGVGWLRALAVRAGELARWDARLALVHDEVLQRVLGARPLAPEVERAWQRIAAAPGEVRIGALAEEVGWSRRHLVSRFTAHVGVPPKTAARVVRFERAVRLLAAGVPQAEVAARCGYYDQAHLHREVRALAGAPPGALAPQVTSVQDDRPVPG